MKNNKNKFVISTLISLISLCYIGMAFSYAWFFSLRSQKNAADNLKIVIFEGEIYEYIENYEMENGNKTYKGFQGNQTFSDTEPNKIFSYFEKCTTIDFTMPTLLPNTKYLYLLKLRHNMETAINANFYINSYESYYGQRGQDQTQAPHKDENNIVSLSEAINIYIYEYVLTETTYADGLNALVNYVDYKKYEKFHKINDNDTEIKFNYYTSMDTAKGGVPFLTSVSIPTSTSTDPYYYVPIMFEFSDKKETYYRYDSGYFVHDATDGNSNAYKNLTFEITEFEVTPYTK